MLEELHAISIPELRRRVDKAVAYLREMRRALAVQAGMTLEDAPGPIPSTDLQEGRIALEEMMASLPLLRRPLTPEERAKIVPVSKRQQEAGKEMLEELLASDEALAVLAEGDPETGAEPVTREKLVALRESFDKSDMLEEFQREVRALHAEMVAFRDMLEARMAADAALIAASKGPSN